jgi:hypothetical protein
MIKRHRIHRPKYSAGGELVDNVVEGIHKIIDWWKGTPMPDVVANFLKSHGEDEITSLTVGRVPISKVLDLALDVMSGGEFGKVKKALSYDKMFHLFVVINGKHKMEKNELFTVKPYSRSSDEENVSVPLGDKKITISQFLKKASEGDEKSFYRDYDPFKRNCQDMVLRLLRSNGLLTAEVQGFIKQDVERFVRDLNAETREKAINITNVGSLVNRLLQLVSGGKLSLAVGGRVPKRAGLVHRINGSRK